MPQYKLTYYDCRGAGESLRYILSYAKQQFEDVRIPLTEYPFTDKVIEKYGLPWGVVPTLSIEGKVFGECVPIARYLGKIYGFAGETELEQLKCDELVDAFKDYHKKWFPAYEFVYGPNADKVKRDEATKVVLEKDTPIALTRFEKIIQANPAGYFVGNKLTWADIYIAYNLTALEIEFEVKLVNKFPGLQKLVEKVESAPGIKEWIAKRPVTQF